MGSICSGRFIRLGSHSSTSLGSASSYPTEMIGFRTHSLQIGGATMMAAAGRPDYEIQKVGRWKSLAFLEYIRLGRATFKSALDAICNPVGFTIDDIRCLNSGG